MGRDSPWRRRDHGLCREEYARFAVTMSGPCIMLIVDDLYGAPTCIGVVRGAWWNTVVRCYAHAMRSCSLVLAYQLHIPGHDADLKFESR